MLASLLQHTLQHLFLASFATLIAALIAISFAAWMQPYSKIRMACINIANILQTIPSLALLALLIPWVGIGTTPTIIALTAYAILPILRNTDLGLRSIPESTLEAAYGLGMSRWQRLWKVELPLALPETLGGIRIAAASSIGITTVAAFIGAGGLGDFITQGLALSNHTLILWGAIPAALLALIVDYWLKQCEWLLTKYKHPHKNVTQARAVIIFIVALFCGLVGWNFSLEKSSAKQPIIVASKNFTEQLILGHIIKDTLTQAGLPVKLKLNFGATSLLTPALKAGYVDLYPEYTGTAYMAVMHGKKLLPKRTLYSTVNHYYQKNLNSTWLKPLGFVNSQALCIPKQLAKQQNIYTLSALSNSQMPLHIAAPAAFLKRPDAFPLLEKMYGIHFASIVQMEPDLMYDAIKQHNVNVVACFTTDGQIAADHLIALRDDKHAYPVYQAAIVVRTQTLKDYPKLKNVLEKLSGKISTTAMQRMNEAVEVKHQMPRDVAKRFSTVTPNF